MTPNPVVLDHANRLLDLHPALANIQGEAADRTRAVIEAAFADSQIQKEYAGAAIRHTAMCGEVARLLLKQIGDSPDQIGLLSIGDIDLPPEAREVALQILNRAHEYHMQFVRENGLGYDLTSQGQPEARRSMIDYFDRHYGFSDVPGLLEKLVKNSTIVGGGMRGLDDIATAMVRTAALENRTHRFIHPDNSFGTWHSIVELRSHEGEGDRKGKGVAKIHKIPTAQKDQLHLTADQVNEFYNDHPATEVSNDSWCITPVGNPSGTRMQPAQLTQVCQAIVAKNPDAKIVLDCTYVRTLPAETARELMSGVINDPAVLDRIIFVDSFSKTHGFAGVRIGTYFSANPEVYGPVQTVNMTLSAGNGSDKNGTVMALTNPTPEQDRVISELHQFWARERVGLHHYLVGSGRFPHLFDKDQSHIVPEQLQEPLGLYVLIKLKPGVDGKQVLLETACLGVETQMGSGRYMRFAVGKIKTPTYAKYLDN